MIKERICFTIHCDSCGGPYRYDEFQPHFNSVEQAQQDIDGGCYDWVRLADQTICPGCAWKSHRFELKPNTTDECWRCPHPADEHDEDPAGGGA